MTSPTPTSDSPKAAHRDGLAAILLLGLVMAALGLGYHDAASGIARPADAQHAEAVVPDALTYDLDTAMKLAGDQLPPDKDGYYFVAFLDEAPAEREISELAEKLYRASQEHDYIGITGPDAERNRRNLLAALKADEGEDLAGAVIIFVGPEAHREELSLAVKPTGAGFRFVVYPAEEDAPDTLPPT